MHDRKKRHLIYITYFDLSCTVMLKTKLLQYKNLTEKKSEESKYLKRVIVITNYNISTYISIRNLNTLDFLPMYVLTRNAQHLRFYDLYYLCVI